MEKDSHPIVKETRDYDAELKSMGVDPVEFVFSIMMESLFVDIAHSWSFHLESLLKKSERYNGRNKQLIKKIKDLLHEFSLSISKSIGISSTPEEQLKAQIDYGDRSDFIRECCILLTQIKPDDRPALLRHLKNTVSHDVETKEV